jgi:autotransporter-associated beta strand protein
MKTKTIGRCAPLLTRMLIVLFAAVGAKAADMPLAAGETLLGGQVWGSGTSVAVDLVNDEPSSYSIGMRLDAEANGLWLHVTEDRSLHLVHGSPSGNGAADSTTPLRHLWCASAGFRINDFGDRIDICGMVGSVPVPLVQIDLHDDHIVAYYNGRMLAYPALPVPIAASGRVGVHADSGPLAVAALDAAAMDPATERFALTEHANGTEMELVETFAAGMDHPRLFRSWYDTTAWADGILTLGRIDTLMKYGEAEIRMDLAPVGSNIIEIGMRQTYPFNRPWKVGGTWLVFQGNSNVLRIRKSISESQAEVSVTMPQTFNTGWTIRISESNGVLRVYREQIESDTLLAELVETGGMREVRDANGTPAGVVPLERTERGHLTIKGGGSLDSLSISGSAWHSAADRPPPVYTPNPADVFHVETAGRLVGVQLANQSTYADSKQDGFTGVEELLQYPEIDRDLYQTDEFWLRTASVEPVLDYKTAGNPDVIRTYLQMKIWAGVDFMIFMDSSNFDWGDLNDNYLDTLDLWLEIMLDMQAEGKAVPRAVFWVNNNNSMDGSAMEVYERYYSRPEYRDLWLYKNGKPMLFTTQTRETHFSVLQDYFTVRSMWVTQNNLDWAHNMLPGLGGSWEVLENRGNVIDGVLEHMFANPSFRIGVYHDQSQYSTVDRMPNGLFTDVELLTDLDDGWWRGRNQGRSWQIQWTQIFEQQPLFVTSMAWNEFGHSFDQEYGRVIAPMKDGHADRYLWMLRQYIAAYKAGSPFPENLLESDFPFAGVMPISASDQNRNLGIDELWAPGIDWPWPGHNTVLTNSANGHLIVQMEREARQWTMEGVEAVLDPPVDAGFRDWLTMTVQLRDVMCERPQDYELKIRVFGGGRWTECTYLLTEGEWQSIAMDLSGFEQNDRIEKIKVWVQGTRNTEYADWSADLELRNVWLAASVTRAPGRYNVEVATWPQEQDGLRPGDQVPVYVTNYDTETLTGDLEVTGGDGVDFAQDAISFDPLEPRESTVLYLQGRRVLLEVDSVAGHPLLSGVGAVFRYGDTELARRLAGPEDALADWEVNPAWDDVNAVDEGILFGTDGGMIWPEPGGIHLPESGMIGDLRAAFNLRLVEAGSANWFHFNFRKAAQSSQHFDSGGYSVRIESHFIRLVAGSNQTLLSVDLQGVLGSGFSFLNGVARVEITVIGEMLSVSVDGVTVLETDLWTLSEELYADRGWVNFFNAANRGAYSMDTINLEILDPPNLHVWKGASDWIGWNANENWEDDVQPPFDNTTDLLWHTAGAGHLESYMGSHNPVLRSFRFNHNVQSEVRIHAQRSHTKPESRTITFEADSGPASVAIAPGASGDVAFTGVGHYVLGSDLNVIHDGAGLLVFESAISGPGRIFLAGTGTVRLEAENSFTGGCVIEGGSTLLLAGGGSLALQIGPFDANTRIDGDGAVHLDGALVLDLDAADAKAGNSWTIISGSLDVAYGAGFHVDGFTDEGGGRWIRDEAGTVYVFEQATGVLAVEATEPPDDVMLEIAPAVGGGMRVAWPLGASNAVVQASTNLVEGFAPIDPEQIVAEGDYWVVYDDEGLPIRFYRLVR